MSNVYFPPFLVREEAYYRAIGKNGDFLHQFDAWINDHPGHSIQAKWYIEELMGTRFLSIEVQGSDPKEVEEVTAILERWFERTKLSDHELFKDDSQA